MLALTHAVMGAGRRNVCNPILMNWLIHCKNGDGPALHQCGVRCLPAPVSVCVASQLRERFNHGSEPCWGERGIYRRKKWHYGGHKNIDPAE
jgi:hypothetical protein